MEKIKQQQKEAFEAFVVRQHEVEKRWKKLKHDEAFVEFQRHIKEMEFVNPDNRKTLYAEVKAQHLEIFG